MNRRTVRWLAWGCFAIALACLVIVPVLTLTAPNAALYAGQSLPSDLFQGLALIGFPLVGALIASRHPENPIGWLFCSVTLASVAALAESLALRALAADPGAAAGAWLAWVSVPLYRLGYFLIFTFTLLLYPTGRLPSRRWRPVAWLTAAWLAVDTLGLAFAPGPLGEVFPELSNPLGIEGLDAAARLSAAVELPTILALALAATASLIVRYRRALPDERQQIKWFAYAAAVLFVAGSIWGVLDVYVPPTFGITLLGETMFGLSAAALPVATGFAILRYRLYDIEVVIRRTLIYGALTAALALVYFGSVVILQSVFWALTGETSQLAVVASTLTIAALFAPLRGRVQDFIDQRFYRRRYNAAHILSEFAATARDETDLDRLAARLIAVVEETMQPELVSLWVRELAPEQAPAGERLGGIPRVK